MPTPESFDAAQEWQGKDTHLNVTAWTKVTVPHHLDLSTSPYDQNIQCRGGQRRMLFHPFRGRVPLMHPSAMLVQLFMYTLPYHG